MTIARDIARSVGSSVRAGNIGTEGAITGQFSATIYDSTTDLPTSGVERGAQGYVSSNQRLYIRGTGGWYNIATINNTPTINSVQTAGGDSSPFALATDGTTTTVITITATDSEGFPVTFSAVTDTGFDSIATVSQDSSVFTITPFSADSAGTATSGTLTFKASDGVNIASEVATFTLEFTVTKSNFSTLLMKASGDGGVNTTINDASSDSPASNTAHTITVNGNAGAQAFTPYHPGGYSVYFDGSGDYLSIADSSDFTLGTSNFTAECWIYPTGSPNQPVIFGQWSDPYAWAIELSNNSSRYLRFLVHIGGYVDVISTDTIAPLNEWSHLALVRNGSTFTLYFNGVSALTTTNSGSITDASSALTIGGQSTGGSPFEGYIRDARFVVGDAVYTANFTPPTSPLASTGSNTKLLACHLPYIADGSTGVPSTARTITVGGNAKTKRFSPYDYLPYSTSSHGASVYFDGTGDYLQAPASNDWGFGTSAWTIEFWYNSTDTASHDVISAFNTSTPFAGWAVNVGQGGAGLVTMFISNGSSNDGFDPVSGSTTINDGSWHHVVVTAPASSTTVTCYIDGVAAGSHTFTVAASATGQVLRVGCDTNTSPARYTEGYLSDVRIVTGSQVYTSAFTPPTSPLTAIANTKLLTCNDSANIFNAAGTSNTITLTNDVESDTGVKKYTSSMLFDGTGDMIEIGDDINLDFGSEDFTIEGWYKAGATNSDHYLLSSSGGSFNAGPSHFGINIYQGNWRVGGFNDKLIGGVGSGVNTGIDTTTWHHFAWTQNNRNIQFFIDGVQTGSTVDVSSDTFDCGGSFKIGSFHNGNQSNWNGNLEDIRISKGLCRYPFISPRETLTLSDHANTKLIACHSSTATTDGAGLQTITANGTPLAGQAGPHPGMLSVYFDGSNEALRTSDDSSLSMGTGDFTIEAWIKPDNTSSAYRAIISDNIYGQTSGSWCIYHYGTKLYIAANTGSGGNAISTLGGSGNTVLSAGVWSHIAFTRASGTARLFHNGIQVGSDTSLTTDFTDDQILIGANNHAGGYPNYDFIGYISNVRVIKGTAIYNKTFTPPTSELTA